MKKMVNNREYFYPLYEKEDKRFYDLIVSCANNVDKPKMLGDIKDFSRLFTDLIVTGKSKNWRQLFGPLYEQFKKGVLDLKNLSETAGKIEVPYGVVKSWAVFTQDKKLCNWIDKLRNKDVRLTGSMEQALKLLKRYILSEFLQDWRGPKMAMVIEISNNPNIEIKELIDILKNWDFTGVFNSRD